MDGVTPVKNQYVQAFVPNFLDRLTGGGEREILGKIGGVTRGPCQACFTLEC